MLLRFYNVALGSRKQKEDAPPLRPDGCEMRTDGSHIGADTTADTATRWHPDGQK
jgi:hypothetical protein